MTPETTLEAQENDVVVAWYSDTFTLRFRKDVGYVETASLEIVKKEYEDFEIKDLRLIGAANLDRVVYPSALNGVPFETKDGQIVSYVNIE